MGLSRAQIIDQDPGHAPLFHGDLRDVGFFFKDFIYFFMWQRANQQEREHKQGSGRGRSRLPVEEPDEGLLSGTPGSRPELKADT